MSYLELIQRTIQECKKKHPGQDNRSAVFLEFIDDYNRTNVNIDPNNNQQLLDLIKKQHELIRMLAVLAISSDLKR